MSRRRGSRMLVGGEARGRGGLVLPGDPRAGGRPQLFVPPGYETGREIVLVGVCSTCDRRFYRGEEEDWQRHVGKCARQHLPEILAAREDRKKRLAVFQEENWDVELQAHLNKVGERMLREGRLEMKPNERSYE